MRGWPVDGKRLRKLRMEQGLLQSELADKVQCSTAFISRIESGQRAVSNPILTGLAEALNVHYDVLLGNTPLPGRGSSTIDVPVVILAADTPAVIAADVMNAVHEICERHDMQAVLRRPDARGTLVVGRRTVEQPAQLPEGETADA